MVAGNTDMTFRYLPDLAIADVAFEAWGDSLEDLFRSAADATMNVMVGDLAAIAARESRAVQAEESEPDMLLFQLLQELIFYKDAERLLLRVRRLQIRLVNGGYRLEADLQGEEIDVDRHELIVDVKAVTLHRFCVEKSDGGWKATVILDV